MRRDVAAPRDLPLFEGQAFVGGTPLPLGPERCVPATHWALGFDGGHFTASCRLQGSY